jgi:EAL domain-containing protein (putative c-di-GMP-specific phosphodiesterase class I)
MGISYIDREFGSANNVLLHAEKAYEKARGRGGNRGSLAPADAARGLPPEREETIDLTQGFSAENLAICYQAMISLEHQKIAHYEVLVRWRNRSGELIPAAKFLRHIENSSMQIELDRWVLQNAVNAVANDSLTRENASLFIHLSANALQQKSFFAFAANVLRSSRLRGDRRLVFMLSEPWINSEMAQAKVIINALRDIHCGVCLTQAGSTPSSEDLIAQYKFDYVKLAPQLTAKLQGEALTELQHVAELARVAGSQIIAAQVEDAKNLTKLWLQGVRLFQGFFIQMPEQNFISEAQMEFYEAGHKTF